MTTPIANIDNTTLLNLTPNLDIDDVADPALRLAYFQYLNVYIQTITTAFNAFVANGGVGTVNLADLSVTTGKLALLAVTTAILADSSVTSAKIADGTITTGDIADSAITSAKIADATIVTGDLADNAITTAKITDLNVTTAKIASLAITAAQIADLTITSGKLALLAVGTGQLADSAVTSAKIANGTIVDADINSLAAIAWSKISKTSSSLADLATRLASDITTDSTHRFTTDTDISKLASIITTSMPSFAVPADGYLTFGNRFKIGYNSTTDTLDTYET